MREGSEHAGLRTGPVGSFTYAHRKALRITAVALAALLFVFWGLPTVLVAIVITLVLLVVLGLIELIGRPPAGAATAARPDGSRRPAHAVSITRNGWFHDLAPRPCWGGGSP